VGRNILLRSLAVGKVEPGIPLGDGPRSEGEDVRKQRVCRPRTVRQRGGESVRAVTPRSAGLDDRGNVVPHLIPDSRGGIGGG
jgi:hypothetical protein